MVEDKAGFWYFTRRELTNIKEDLKKLKKLADSEKLQKEATEQCIIRKGNFSELEE